MSQYYSDLEVAPAGHPPEHQYHYSATPSAPQYGSPQQVPLYELPNAQGYYEAKPQDNPPHKKSRRKICIISIALLALLLIGAVIGGAVGGTIGKHKPSGASTSSAPPPGTTPTSSRSMSGTALPQNSDTYPTAVAAFGSDYVNVAVLGKDTALNSKNVSDAGSASTESVFTNLHGLILSNIAAVSRLAGSIDVLVRGTDSGLYHKYHVPGSSWGPSFSDYEPRGGIIITGPEAISWSENWLSVFALGTDSNLCHMYWHNDASGWRQWQCYETGWSKYAPTAVSWQSGRLDLFLINDTDRAMYTRTLNQDITWDPPDMFAKIGGYCTGRPAAVSWGIGRIDVFVRGGDSGLWHTYLGDGSNGWSAFESLGGNFSAEPHAVSWAAGRLDVFAWGTDSEYYHKSYDGHIWTPSDKWESLGGNFKGPPKAVCKGVGRLSVFGISAGGELLHRSWDDTRKSWSPSNGYESLGAL